MLVRNNQIVHETHDGCIESCDPTMHAERRLISEYCQESGEIDLEGYMLYSSAEPCIMCCGAIHWAKISRVVYSVPQKTLNKKSGGREKPSCDELLNIGNRKIEVLGEVLLEAGLEVFKDYKFIQKRHRVKRGSAEK